MFTNYSLILKHCIYITIIVLHLKENVAHWYVNKLTLSIKKTGGGGLIP